MPCWHLPYQALGLAHTSECGLFAATSRASIALAYGCENCSCQSIHHWAWIILGPSETCSSPLLNLQSFDVSLHCLPARGPLGPRVQLHETPLEVAWTEGMLCRSFRPLLHGFLEPWQAQPESALIKTGKLYCGLAEQLENCGLAPTGSGCRML